MYTICVLIVSSSQVSEFSPSTSSAMGLPREFHENCHKSLEQNFLKVLLGFHLLLDIVTPTSTKGSVTRIVLLTSDVFNCRPSIAGHRMLL